MENYRIKSIDGQDISTLYEEPFNFDKEILCCYVEFVVMQSYYNDKHPFVYWNTNVDSRQFASALISCVLEMFCQIVKEKNGPKLND